ncbi:MAG TPA: futalosine hydrolase [Desulfomonilaceae bacterium]|nr:futalosine hydrolase [Desulfomonilaceae bacterium]
MNLLIVAALENELDVLKRELHATPAGRTAGCAYYKSCSDGNPIYVSPIGVGIVSAGLALGALIQKLHCDRIVLTGSAGAFPESGLCPGDVAVASTEILAELGVCRETGPAGTGALAFPGLDREIPLDKEVSRDLTESAREIGKAEQGPFLTVVGVSGNSRVAEARYQIFSALAENMEGYAVARAGTIFHVRVGEIRGISNTAGSRDKSSWKLGPANEIAQKALLNYIRKMR